MGNFLGKFSVIITPGLCPVTIACSTSEGTNAALATIKSLTAMTNAGMSMIMQTATNKMFHSITKDFESVTYV